MKIPPYTVNPAKTFADAYLDGSAAAQNIFDYLNYWSENETEIDSPEDFLGLHGMEYDLWRTGSISVQDIFACRTNDNCIEAAWSVENRLRLKEIETEISGMKESFFNGKFMSNAETDEMLCRIGERMTEKNELTGMNQDANYLYYDDREWDRHVCGFIGDPANVVDRNGNSLTVGDSVLLRSDQPDGNPFVRMVMLQSDGKCILDQNTLLSRHAQKENGIIIPGIWAANVFPNATVSIRSCVEDFENALGQNNGLTLQ